MATITKTSAGMTDWASDTVISAALIAFAGMTYGYDRIVAANSFLRRLRAEAGPASPIDESQEAMPCVTKQHDLERALERWDNEGGH